MKPTFRVSLSESQAGENSQSNVPEHTIVSTGSILTDLIFRRNLSEEQHFWDQHLICEAAKVELCVKKIQNQHTTIMDFNINFQSWILQAKD